MKKHDLPENKYPRNDLNNSERADHPAAASLSSGPSSATSPAGSISGRAGNPLSPASPQPGSSPQMASPTTDRYASDEVVAKSETPLDASGGRVRRVRIVRTAFKYPLVRVEETVSRAAGADTVIDQKAMLASLPASERPPERSTESAMPAHRGEPAGCRNPKKASGRFLDSFL